MAAIDAIARKKPTPEPNPYTVDSANVTAGKVVLCFFRSDSVNSDYSLNVTVKYHLT